MVPRTLAVVSGKVWRGLGRAVTRPWLSRRPGVDRLRGRAATKELLSFSKRERKGLFNLPRQKSGISLFRAYYDLRTLEFRKGGG